MVKLFNIIILFISFISSAESQTKFAVIGDYGFTGTNELNVSNLVKSWNPEFIITLGDNNYDYGEASTIDANIGQYYRQFIYPYTGGYGAGDTVNRFFPSMGNHDWYTLSGAAYLSYFTLPGNERYYDFVKGDIHFFVIDSDPNEPSGVDSNSVQAQWLKLKLSQSAEKYNLVYFHHPPYSSGLHGSSVYMQWPFRKWGATAVLSGHDHTYERIYVDSMVYFVNGLGGRSIYTLGTPVTGSQVRYNNNYGAMLVNSYNDSLVFRFYSVSVSQKDYYKILPIPKTLNLISEIEGFYSPVSNKMISDSVKILLRNFTSPYEITDSSISYPDSNGNASYVFKNAKNATDYYIVLKHRNSIETWGSSGKRFINNSLNYDFTSSISKAFGDNLKLKGSKYCIISGDINQDGTIEAGDISLAENDLGETGYVNSDVTGDNYVDADDLSLVENNLGVNLLRP